VARYGADEFAILMPETNTQQAEILAEELRAAVEADGLLRAHEVTASIGIATFPDHGRTQEQILRAADSGIHLAKRCDGNCVKVASLSPKAEDAERGQELLEAYLGVDVKGKPSAEPDIFIHYQHESEEMKPLLETISALAFAVEARGPYMKDHSRAVSRLAAQIALQAGLSQAETEEIRLAGLVHDIGKIHVPEHVLKKPRLLTAEEFEIIKSHPALGAEMLEPLNVKAIERIVRHHHERYDGKGYPDGLAGDRIPLGARIVAVAECFHNMVSDLRYKSARTFEDALAELRRCSGTQFDPKVVMAFLDWLQIHGDRRRQQ
jgi:putative nucleotidyltransferase with HDIG domain